MQHPGGISHSVEVHEGKASWCSSELVQHQPDVLHTGVLGYGHVHVALTAAVHAPFDAVCFTQICV